MPTWRCLNDSELKLILYVILKLPFALKHLLFLPQGQPELAIGWWWLHWQNAYLRHTHEDKVQPQTSGCLIGAWAMEENKFTLQRTPPCFTLPHTRHTHTHTNTSLWVHKILINTALPLNLVFWTLALLTLGPEILHCRRLSCAFVGWLAASLASLH